MREGPAINRKALMVSFIAAALGFALLATYVRRFQQEARGGDLVDMLALRKGVSATQPLDEQSLVVRALPESYVDDRHVLASDLPRVLGVRAANDLKANQWLLWTDLASAERDWSSLSSRVPKGMRAISVEQGGRRAFGELLRPGDRVDVLLTKEKPGGEPSVVTVPLLQNLLVLAVGNSTRPVYDSTSSADPSSVTLLVTVEQASLLVQARRGGELSLILRNEEDLEINEGLAETDDSDILELEERERRQRRAPIERVD
jgi:pilus assembly protein CpaB